MKIRRWDAMKIDVHLLDGTVDSHEGDYPNPLDVSVRDGILSVVWSRYQGAELRRVEYPLTSIRNWEYTR